MHAISRSQRRRRRTMPRTALAVTGSVALLLAGGGAAAATAPVKAVVVRGSAATKASAAKGVFTQAAVTGLTVQSAIGGSLLVSWQAGPAGVAGAGYTVTVTGGSGSVVATTVSHSLRAVVTGLKPGTSYHVAVAPVATATRTGSLSTTTAPATVTSTLLADAAPQALVALGAAPARGTNELTVGWTSPVSGVAAAVDYVNLFSVAPGGGLDYVAGATCGQGCTAVTFRQLSPGTTYRVAAIASNAAGFSPAAWSSVTTLPDPCSTSACVSVDATKPGAAMSHPGDGVLDSLYPVGSNASDLASLPGASWRGSPDVSTTGALTYASYDAATSAGAPTTVVLSNLWAPTHADGAAAATPWSNWSTYRAWVTQIVRTIELSGRHPTYWEIQNEPGGSGYYSAAGQATVTPALLLQQFLVGYQAVRAADPSAQIVGPALEHFSDTPGQYGAQEFDMGTFLDFAAAHGLTLAAVSWHEIDDNLGPEPQTNSLLPAMIGGHVAEARTMLAARPALGHPKIFIDEYNMPEVGADPGWSVAYLAALTTAGVDEANRSCWSVECANPTLDGLLGYDGKSPRADWWTYVAYGAMNGNLLPTTSSDDTIATLATTTSGRVQALVGRADGCITGGLVFLCSLPLITDVRQVQVEVAVPWKASTVTVRTTVIPATDALTGALPATTSTATVVNGTVTVPLTMTAGEAYSISLTPAS